MRNWRNTMGGAVLVLLAFAGVPRPAHAVESADPIKISLMGSNDGDLINYAFGGILQAAGYNVQYIQIDYTAMVSAVETGDLDVATAFWDTTGWDNFMDAVKSGNVVNYGFSGIRVHEGWWYPLYLKEYCPGLPDWTALKNPKCVKALSTVETAPRGRLVDAPPDWETDSQKRLDGFGLKFEAISAGSPITMVATIQAAVKKKEPVIGWGFLPHWFYESTPGEFVTFPKIESACYTDPSWGPNPNKTWDCGYVAGYIWKLANKNLLQKWPGASRLLFLFHMTSQDVSDMLQKVELDNQDIRDVAKKWLEDHKATWSKWIS